MAPGSENQFGKYELLGRIAAGGMAEIFRARYSAAAGVTKQVVIKRILPHYAENKSFIQMFTNEARIAMGLSHGNIAQVFDFGDIDGDWYLAMEYVDGQPLSKVLKRARAMAIPAMPTAFACVICIELLKGLHYAHTRLDDQGRPLKIIHRDVSPQNVLISFEGQIKIVDFGIAKARNAGHEDTEAGALKGKYTYFSPEQARGKDLDARTDIFAAGIILYEMLCGQLPFQGRMIDTLSKIVRGEFPPPRAVNPEIAPELEQIMLTALAHEKGARYQTAEAFQQALSSYLYQTVPSFQVNTLATFMSYLFEQELVNEGRPVQLGRDFLDQLALWKKVLPTPPVEPAEFDTAFERRPEKKPPRPAAGEAKRSAPAPGVRPWPRRARLAAIAAVVVGAAAVAAVLVFALDRVGTFSVQLQSVPVGAAATVDGQRVPQPTPVQISNLSSSQPHRLEVSAVGMRPWSHEVRGHRGEVVEVRAELEPIEVAAAPTNPAEARPAQQSPQVAMGATWPATHFAVHPAQQSFLVPETGASHLTLDPRRSYRVWVEGRVSLGATADHCVLTECGYLVQGGQAKDSFGVVGRAPVVIHHASGLYAFVLDERPDDNTGAFKLKVREVKGGPTLTLLVDGRQAAVSVRPTQRFTVDGLSPLAQYAMTVKEGAPPAHSRGERGGRVNRVLFGQSGSLAVAQGKASANEGQRALEVGKTYRVTGAQSFWLAFPDDVAGDESGALEVELEAVADTSPALPRR